MGGRDDSLWKAILEDVMDDFLRFFYPDAAEFFDFSAGFVFLDKELQSLFPQAEEQGSPRYVDKLVKVYTRAGKEQWILIHIEVQSYPEKHFPERMFHYYYRILDRYHRPVTAFAIFTGKSKKPLPCSYEQAFLGTSIIYEYNACQLSLLEEEALLRQDNPFALVALIARTAACSGRRPDEVLMERKLELAKRLLERDIPVRKVRAILQFLKAYIRFEDQKNYTNFDNQLDIVTNKKQTMGIEEFLAERAREEERAAAKKQIERTERRTAMQIARIEKRAQAKVEKMVAILMKHTDFTDKKIARLAGVSLDFVTNVKQRQKL